MHGTSDMLEEHRVSKVKVSAWPDVSFKKEHSPTFSRNVRKAEDCVPSRIRAIDFNDQKNFLKTCNIGHLHPPYILKISFIINEVIRRVFFICHG